MLPEASQAFGDGLVLIAAILWGTTTVVIKATRLAAIGAHRNLVYQLGFSAPLLLALSWRLGEPGIVEASPVVLGMLFYQIVLVAFASYLAWFWLIQRYPAGRLASFTFSTPLFGLIAGALVLQEHVTWTLVVALIRVGVGIYLVNDAPSPSRAA